MTARISPSLAEQTDIEIYIKRPELGEIHSWLSDHFATIHWAHIDDSRLTGTLAVTASSTACEVLVLKNAVKGFASVWIKQNRTPWADDLACARSAWQAIQREVRANAGAWQDGDEEDLFYRIDAGGETTQRWRTG